MILGIGLMVPETVQGQVADLYKQVAEINRRLQNRSRTGTVSEVDAEKGVARVILLEDDGTGKPFKSPWVQWREMAMGQNKTHMPPSVGQQVALVSENGDLTDAVIDMSLPSENNPRPSDKGDSYILSKVGPFELHVSDGGGKAVIKVGGTSLTLTEAQLVVSSPDIEINKS